MARWRPLPATLSPETRRLVQRLRLLKDRTGLSYSALAGRTPYSASSWHRYLGGAAFPPRDAVDALGELAGVDARGLVRLGVLWETADAARRTASPAASATPSTAASAAPVPAPAPGSVPGAAPAPEPGSAPAPVSREPVPGPRQPEPARAAPTRAAAPASRVPPVPQAPAPPGAHRPASDAAYPHAPSGTRAEGLRTRVPRALLGVLAVALLAGVPASTAGGAVRPEWPWPVPAPAPGAGADSAAGCRGRGCAGLDAERAGCARDRRSLGRYVRDGHRVELFHSPACGTVWGEVVPSDDVRGLSLSVRGAGQRWEPAGAARTRMLPAPATLGSNVQFCAVLPDVQACLDAGHQVWSGSGAR
ncbi:MULTISPECIES: helix-turn-helix domain-containing protein [Streptomyces]|uniref:helix-turn-helix domain-containing protein n=1 Tax=Streptomyces TaxID=1883 RepID=UPI00224977A7|nr:helix-turn-helix transcriptional regulator [Streptomyces sp. JHD 1]MCX2969768.1 helix-turn-helix transcriptional regulator [Streptomyces sp. JHD 1]